MDPCIQGAHAVFHKFTFFVVIEDMVCKVKLLEDKIVQIDLPTTVEVKVKDTSPHTKNMQAAAQYVFRAHFVTCNPCVMLCHCNHVHSDKKALLENGRTVKVPTYVNTGDVVIMRLPEETFVQRKQ
jgi:hypothetical protein